MSSPLAIPTRASPHASADHPARARGPVLRDAAGLIVALCLALSTACAREPGAPPAPAAPGASAVAPAAASATAAGPGYETIPATRDGIGKRYMGRQIARVMSHQAAAWLERPERVREERPDQMIEQLGLAPGMVVADFGAGTGYFSTRLARVVGPTGRVLAVDVQPEMLSKVDAAMREAGIGWYETLLATPDDPKLPPASVDLVLMVDVYHELEYPYEVLARLARALRPGGRIAFVEYKAEDPAVPIKTLHMMSEAQIRREAAVAGLQWQRTYTGLPWQHLVVFTRTQAAR